eukprot:6171923-Pleurochrysis_carterae.AAC.2
MAARERDGDEADGAPLAAAPHDLCAHLSNGSRALIARWAIKCRLADARWTLSVCTLTRSACKIGSLCIHI